jgi:serine/threonine protein kinase
MLTYILFIILVLELGIRAYDLEIDPTVAKKQENERRKQEAIEAHEQKGKPKILKAQSSQEAISISGKMFLRISVPKSDKNDIPIVWRVEIVKASKIACAHKTQKSTPFCQVFWRGVAEIDGVMKEYDEWLEIGVTKAKEKTLDPQWKKDEGNVFEMPPMWTKYDVPGRGPTGETVKGGCWVARNNLPDGDPAAAKTKLSALDRMRKEEKAGKEAAEQKVLKAMHNHDENLGEIFQQTNTAENSERSRLDGLIKAERNVRMEMYRFMLESEETERKCMSIEDNLMRKYIIDTEVQRTKKYVDEQVLFSKQYSRIIYSLINPPQVLERVQYNMGRPLDGGGTRVMCLDPSSRKTFEVIAIPILYGEDEEMLTKQLSFMIGRFHLNLIKIFDYSIHQLRKFTHSGFTSADERLAMVVTDCPIGPLFGDFVRLNWGSMSNHQFRVYLQQIVGALSQLHSDGIIHRNIHPECVVVLLPETEEEVEDSLEDDSGTDKGSKLKIKNFKYDQPICKLGDYWFLHNPRKSGCAYSFGRADWGAPATAAPEVTQGALISNKTDIWALGMCIFHWATCGTYPNFDFDSIETISTHIPLKWDSWVHSIIRMCLQQNRDYRASADEIFTFLGTLKLKR